MNYQVKIHKVFNTKKTLKAVVSVTIDDQIVIHGIRVVETQKGRFLGMPSNIFKNKDGNEVRSDIVHPVTVETRKELEKAVFAAYETALKENNQ